MGYKCRRIFLILEPNVLASVHCQAWKMFAAVHSPAEVCHFTITGHATIGCGARCCKNVGQWNFVAGADLFIRIVVRVKTSAYQHKAKIAKGKVGFYRPANYPQTHFELAGDPRITSTLGSKAKGISKANSSLEDGASTQTVIVVIGKQIFPSIVTPFDGIEIKVFPIKVQPVDVTKINILECLPSKVGFLLEATILAGWSVRIILELALSLFSQPRPADGRGQEKQGNHFSIHVGDTLCRWSLIDV
jgi:hypothetical protein